MDKLQLNQCDAFKLNNSIFKDEKGSEMKEGKKRKTNHVAFIDWLIDSQMDR